MCDLERKIMKTIIMLIIVAAILYLVAGCGPGQPFEIESMEGPPPLQQPR